MSEQSAVLLELADIARRLRILSGTETWRVVVRDLPRASREAVIETVDDIRLIAVQMLDELEPPPYPDDIYGVQR